MEEICKKYKLQTTNNYICLNDIANKIIKSKNAESYVKNIKQKKQIENKYYVTEEKALSIIRNSTSKECKKIVQDYLIHNNDKSNLILNKPIKNSYETTEDYCNKGDIRDTYYDSNDNKTDECDEDNQGYQEIISPFKFNGKEIIGLIDSNLEYWFHGKDVMDIFELEFYPHDIVNNTSHEHRSYGKDLDLLENGTILFNDTDLYINETGIYELVICSTLPDADNFRQWLTHDVLQSLIDNGSYNLPSKTKENVFHLEQHDNIDDNENITNETSLVNRLYDTNENAKLIPQSASAEIQKTSDTIKSDLDDGNILDRYYDLELKKVELEMYKLHVREKELDFEYMKLIGTMEKSGVTIVFEVDENSSHENEDDNMINLLNDKLNGRLNEELNSEPYMKNQSEQLSKNKSEKLTQSKFNDSDYDSDASIDIIEPYTKKKKIKK